MRVTDKLLISLDVTESDIPAVSHAGLLSALELFDRHRVRATFFITACWAQHYPQLVRQLAEQHEVASHLCCYNGFEVPQVERSRQILEEICSKPVYGFRMPGAGPADYVKLKEAGYLYDASTWLPGKPRTPFLKDGMWVMPSSVSPLFRYPVFWLSVKNMPAFVTRHLSRTILKKDHLLSCYLNPCVKMDDKLDEFFVFLKEKGEFSTHTDWLLAFKEF
jgi:hypothetical protein